MLGLNRALNERMSDQADPSLRSGQAPSASSGQTLIRSRADPPVVAWGGAGHADLAL